MRVWIDPDRLAALNLSPGDVHAALRRNNYLAAVGQTKGNLVQVNLLANTDLRSVDEFKELIVADRGGAIVRLADVAQVELGSEEPDFIAKFNDKEAVYLSVWPLVGVERDRGRPPPARRDGRASGRRCRRTSTCSSRTTATMFMEERPDGDHEDADRDDPRSSASSSSCSWARSARRWCRWSRCRSR